MVGLVGFRLGRLLRLGRLGEVGIFNRQGGPKSRRNICTREAAETAAEANNGNNTVSDK
jgi:hypothetical protein